MAKQIFEIKKYRPPAWVNKGTQLDINALQDLTRMLWVSEVDEPFPGSPAGSWVDLAAIAATYVFQERHRSRDAGYWNENSGREYADEIDAFGLEVIALIRSRPETLKDLGYDGDYKPGLLDKLLKEAANPTMGDTGGDEQTCGGCGHRPKHPNLPCTECGKP